MTKKHQLIQDAKAKQKLDFKKPELDRRLT